MIAIVDSGSTKSDWVILDNSYNEKNRIKTIGLNPDIINYRTIVDELNNHQEITLLSSQLKKIYFYGAGCSGKDSIAVIHHALKEIFPYANIVVDHDLPAAAYSAYNGKPTIICILGTGSNSCFYDGKTIRDDSQSLGYILGDEGSGNHLGKELVRAYVNHRLPKSLLNDFKAEFNLTPADIKYKLYKEPFPNRFLASFSRFIYLHKSTPFVQNLVYDCFRSFITNQVMLYPEALSVDLNCVGSIATYYEDILRDVAGEYRISIDQIIQKPINKLVEHHRRVAG